MKQQNLKTQKRSFLHSLSIVNCQLSIAIVALLLLPACGTTSTSTTTKYDTDGNVTEVIVLESDVSDLTSYINAGEDNVTSLNGDITSCSLGYNGVGLKWLSVSGGRQKAPVNSESNSAEALEKISSVVKATKTSIVTETVGVNAEPTGSSENIETEETTTELIETDIQTETTTPTEE